MLTAVGKKDERLGDAPVVGRLRCSILEGDADRAETVMREHVYEGRDFVLGVLREGLPEPDEEELRGFEGRGIF